MCLVAIAWQLHPRYPLVLLGNRDEFHARPAAPADWWPDAPRIYGGRDLRAGGSWLGVSRDGRIAVITNNPQRAPGPDQTESRGQLVGRWLRGSGTPAAYTGTLAGEEHRYGGFALVVGTLAAGFEGFVTPAGSLGSRWQLPAGVSVLSNAPREQPWPKAGWLGTALARYLDRDEPDPGDLLALLERRMPVAPPGGNSPLELARVTPFLGGADYGTRASTLILADSAGGLRFVERRFGPGGVPAGESRVRW